MKVIALEDVVINESPIYYRKLYKALAVMEILQKNESFNIDFSIEYQPTGQKEISIKFLDKMEYPLVPVLRELKAFIYQQETAGILP